MPIQTTVPQNSLPSSGLWQNNKGTHPSRPRPASRAPRRRRLRAQDQQMPQHKSVPCLISHFLNVSLKNSVSEPLLGSLVHWHLLRINETTSLQRDESPLSCQKPNVPTFAQQKLFKKHLSPLSKASRHSSRSLSNDYTTITSVSGGQMSLRIKRCCSIPYFSDLAAR